MLEWLTTRLPKPSRGARGLALVGVIASRLDELVTRAKVAAKLDLPSETLDEALPYVGRDRVILRVPGEGLDSYRARVAGAWEEWSWQGTRYGIGYAVGLLGYGRPVVVTVRDYIIPGWPSSKWAVYRLLYTGRASWGAVRWGAFAWGARERQAIEDIPTEVLRAQLRPILRQWIGARDRVLDITIAGGAPLWGRIRWGAFTWGSPGPSRRIGPSQWGRARWGAFTWGGFC